jgi:hypothetical protein
MGRNSTGSITTGEALRIELSYLIKKGLVKKGCQIAATMEWTNGSRISIESDFRKDEYWLRLIYTLTDNTNEKYNYDYKIYFCRQPSNLGTGDILYFICPESGERARILYKCYGSHKWKHRKAYRNRIYYKSQISSKLDYWNDRYWQLEDRIKKLESEHRNQTYYKGESTKFALKLFKLKMLRNRADNSRWSPSSMPLGLRKAFFKT